MNATPRIVYYVYKSSPFTGYVCYGFFGTNKEAAERTAEELRRSYPLVEVVERWE